MNSTRTISLAFLSIVLSLGLGHLSPSATAQRLDKPDLVQTFPVGTYPEYLAFDGANIWVTNNYDNTVTKLRASDGANLGTFPVGDGPTGIVFDGTSIWVANFRALTVSKLRPSDGTVLGTCNTVGNPSAITSEGSSIWVTNQSADSVTKLRASDGTVLGTFRSATVQTQSYSTKRISGQSISTRTT